MKGLIIGGVAAIVVTVATAVVATTAIVANAVEGSGSPLRAATE